MAEITVSTMNRGNNFLGWCTGIGAMAVITVTSPAKMGSCMTAMGCGLKGIRFGCMAGSTFDRRERTRIAGNVVTLSIEQPAGSIVAGIIQIGKHRADGPIMVPLAISCGKITVQQGRRRGMAHGTVTMG